MDKEKDRFEELYSILKKEVDDPLQSWGDEFDEMLDIYNGLRKQIVNQMDSIDKLLRKVEKLEKENEQLKADLKAAKEWY